jgi:hypothetical protein
MKNNMKKFYLALIFFFVFVLTQPLVHAQADSTEPEASSAATPSLQERVLRVAKEKYSDVKGAIDQLSVQKKGFIGQIERVTQESLTITNTKGTEVIPFDESVTLLKANQEIDIDQVAVGDWLVVMGIVQDEIFTPKRILVSSESLRPKQHLVNIGTIVEQDSQQIKILSRQGNEVTLDLSKQTEFQDHDGQTAQSSDFIADLQVLVVGFQVEDGDKTATVIRSLASLEALQENE